MPLPNRVDPFGAIFATEHRGAFMGNRGGRLHDSHKAIFRQWHNKTWITCVLAFKGVRREVMGTSTYTELFFLDEATAFAAGHRPCAECRRQDYNRFKAAFAKVQTPLGTAIRTAVDLDAVLHRERTTAPRVMGRAVGLPDGAMVSIAGQAWLKVGDRLWRWTPAGYAESQVPPEIDVEFLTPASTLAVLRDGYRAELHPSALANAA